MSNYFKELTIPFHPLADVGIVDEILERKFAPERKRNRPEPHQTACYPTVEFDRVLNPQLLDLFDNLNLRPSVICTFGAENLKAWQTPIHSDVWHKGPGIWGHWPCGINFEVTTCDVQWFFYDTKDHEEKPVRDFSLQQIKNSYPENLQSGSRFGNSPTYVEGEIDQLGFEEISTYNVKTHTWYLNRVETPHSVRYSNLKDASTRMAIQVKFDLRDVPSWEKGLEVFQSYITE